ncbi:paraquat-inducible protein A [bacterium]|nr:paraquat-inducible protein A [bacterium]
MAAHPTLSNTRPEQLIACPFCDALHLRARVKVGQRARCSRCHTVLMAPRAGSYLQVITLSLSVVILMGSAVFFPFLTIAVAGVSRTTSVYEVAFAYSDGILQPLSFVVLAVIMLVPTLRAALLIYAIWPLAHGRPPFARATTALRLAETARPWSMAEVFVFGTSVALVKIAGLATVSLGPAFWAFCGLVLLLTLNEHAICKWTLWQDLEDSARP